VSRLYAASALLVAGACVVAVSLAHADSARFIRTAEDALVDSASIIEGRVADIRFTYHPVEGPRTVAILADVETHAGEFLGSEVQIPTLGGPLPKGRTLFIPELPHFRKGSRYVIFLTASDWFYSPVVANYAFRVENIAGRELLVSQSGHPIVGVSSSGIESAGMSVDLPALELKTRFDRPVLVSDAASRAEGALSKSNFLTLIKALSQTYPPRGTFKRNIASGKAWNITPTDPDR
jgi:hypothetical protein